VRDDEGEDASNNEPTAQRVRVLPPQLLLKWPKEASFCQLLTQLVPTTRSNEENKGG
ncbi:Os08g0295200, partial [Oryza sativa Japonica Group]